LISRLGAGLSAISCANPSPTITPTHSHQTLILGKIVPVEKNSEA
jgi:hypothetical protein